MAVVDPYRTLGVQPGASGAEIKAAYRRLAKLYHPDSAGKAATARFLEVQIAYEMLTSGPARSAIRSRQTSTTRARPAAARPRPRATSSSASGGGSEDAPGSPRRERAGADRTGSRSGPRAGGDRPRGSRRKATMGSTSYDEATTGPLDPGWTGASWYGTDSGTYWTVNPREYADPRKHGPEYQERARRAVGDADGDDRLRGDPPIGTDWSPGPTWSYATPSPDTGPTPAGPPYPGLVAAGLAIGGTALAILTILLLFARP